MRVLRLDVERTWDGSPALPAEAVRVSLRAREAALDVHIDAPFHGDPAPDGPPGERWGLWEHEVVEVFLQGAGPGYVELEVGPHGHHLFLGLTGPRRIAERGLPLELEVGRSRRRWRAVARLPWSALPPGPHAVNAYAIHGAGEQRRFLAWNPVPGPRPDFHRPDRFVGVDLWKGVTGSAGRESR